MKNFYLIYELVIFISLLYRIGKVWIYRYDYIKILYLFGRGF